MKFLSGILAGILLGLCCDYCYENFGQSRCAELAKAHKEKIRLEIGWNPNLKYRAEYAQSDYGIVISFKEKERFEKWEEQTEQLAKMVREYNDLPKK